jgi:hypothetical protein
MANRTAEVLFGGGLMLCILDYAHVDDCFVTARNSGLDRIQVISIDQKAREARHVGYIRENIARRKAAELKELGL